MGKAKEVQQGDLEGAWRQDAEIWEQTRTETGFPIEEDDKEGELGCIEQSATQVEAFKQVIEMDFSVVCLRESHSF